MIGLLHIQVNRSFHVSNKNNHDDYHVIKIRHYTRNIQMLFTRTETFEHYYYQIVDFYLFEK